MDTAYRLADPAVVEFEATRIVIVGSGRGAELVLLSANQLAFCDDSLLARFKQQRDNLGRAMWLRVHAEGIFCRIESLFHADQYRGMPKMYEAFEIRDGNAPQFIWSNEVRQRLELAINEKLGLTETCGIVHVAVNETPRCADESATLRYLFIHHAEPATSVWAMRNRRRQPI